MSEYLLSACCENVAELRSARTGEAPVPHELGDGLAGFLGALTFVPTHVHGRN